MFNNIPACDFWEGYPHDHDAYISIAGTDDYAVCPSLAGYAGFSLLLLALGRSGTCRIQKTQKFEIGSLFYPFKYRACASSIPR